jgi:hypothetical protein
MAEQLVKTPEQIQEEVLNEETDTKLEAKSAVWNGRINLELTRRTMRKTEKKVVENGREVRKIDIDEDTERDLVSYQDPGEAYSREADRVTAEIKTEPEQGGEKDGEGQETSQLVPVKIDVSRPSRELEVVEVRASKEELEPTTEVVEGNSTVQEQVFEVEEAEEFSFEVDTGGVSTVEDVSEGETRYEAESQVYEKEDAEEFSPPEPPIESPLKPDLEVEQNYREGLLEPEISSWEEDFDRFSPLLNDFEATEEYENLGDAIFHAEYGEDSPVSERLVMDLDAMFPYKNSVSGSEAVETLWQEYGVDATVAEVPYFSENSGSSWEEGWNSFDMVVQMEDMDMSSTEYLSGDLYELTDMEQPSTTSIDSGFDTSEAIEFRESEEFGGCSGYEASERTREAWAERYGEEILELDAMERGIYAAFQEDQNFRGASMKPGETDLLSDSAVEML